MYKSGITKMFLAFRISSASGVVGPFAPSAIIFFYRNNFYDYNIYLKNK